MNGEIKMTVLGQNNDIQIKCDEVTKSKIVIYIVGNNNRVVIEDWVVVDESLFIYIINDNNVVSIGRKTTFVNTSISVADCNNRVVIGEDCQFASGIKILASDFHAIIQLETGKRRNFSKGITIDNHVWVGYNVTILKNTYIYSNSIIAAGTVVHGVVPANSIYSGYAGGKCSSVEEKKRDAVTWHRLLDVELAPMLSYIAEETDRINMVEETEDIMISIENDIFTCFNKIKGWAFWKNKNSEESKIYIRCVITKENKKKNVIVTLQTIERTDVSGRFMDDRYVKCGFESYMPAEIIENQKLIESVELIINNGTLWGKKKII